MLRTIRGSRSSDFTAGINDCAVDGDKAGTVKYAQPERLISGQGREDTTRHRKGAALLLCAAPCQGCARDFPAMRIGSGSQMPMNSPRETLT